MASIAAQNDPKLAHAINLIAEDMRITDAAKRAGISISYLSEVSQEDWFVRQVQKLKSARKKVTSSSIAAEIDGKYDNLENMILDAVTNNITLFEKPQLLIPLLRTVNGAKRRSEGEARQPTAEEHTHQHIHLELPSFLVDKKVEHAVNKNNEVIEIDGRTMVTQNSDALLKEVKAKQYALENPDAGIAEEKIEQKNNSEEEIPDADDPNIVYHF